MPVDVRRALATTALATIALACSRAEPPRRIEVRLPPGAQVDPARVVVEPGGAVRSLYLDAGRRTLALIADRGALTLRIPGLCPLPLAGEVREAVARPLFDVVDVLAQVGFDAPIDLRVTPGCAEAAAGRVSWTQREGLPLAALTIAERGLHLTARTLPLDRYLARPLPAGIVPISPRTQGRYVLELVGEAAGHAPVRRTVTVTAIARSTGMASLAVSQRVMLGGEPLAVQRAPRGARAQVTEHDGVQTFAPDVSGRYVLAGARGSRLELTALTHERTPMDCARSECHVAPSARAASSPMSFAFDLARTAGRHGEALPGCMSECHAVGEPGLDDGGFVAVARALGFEPGPAVEAMPHALQRLTGVRCTSCHGPSALPDAQGRARILRSDVCATCHDAPPVYAHVARWRASRMARSGDAPETRAEGCARCHTTGGFLASLGVREAGELEADVGIACAACHAPHGESVAKLVRAVPVPASLASPSHVARTASALCSACHAPEPESLVPAASAAALWLGRVRLPAALGAPRDIVGPAPHAHVPGGCMGCHGATGGAVDHAFGADAARCASCHAGPRPAPNAELAARARALVDALLRACGARVTDVARPRHAQATAAECGGRGGPARALYLALLVAEDRGAGAHNAAFARALLTEAAALAGAAREPRDLCDGGPCPTKGLVVPKHARNP